MKVTLVSQYFYPEWNTTSALLSGIARSLGQRGWDVQAIAGNPSYHSPRDAVPRAMKLGAVSIRRVWSTRMSRQKSIGRYLNTASFWASVTFRLLFDHSEGPVLFVTNPPILHWTGGLVRVLKRRPVVLLFHDIYPDVAERLGALTPNGLIARLWRRLNRWAYRQADLLITVGRDMTSKILEQNPELAGEKVVTIPNWADEQLLFPRDRSTHPLLRRLGLLDRFVVQYAGNIGRPHEIDTVIAAAKKLRGVPIHFMFVGDGAQQYKIERAIHEEKLRNMSLHPFQGRETLRDCLTACDAGIVSLKKEAWGLGVPSKFYSILAVGKPVVGILPAESEIALEISEHHVGFCVEPGDADGLVRCLTYLERHREEAIRLGLRARAVFKRSYTLRTIGGRYEAALRQIVEAPYILELRTNHHKSNMFLTSMEGS